MPPKYVAPRFDPLAACTGFNCPCCGAYSQQDWYDLIASSVREGVRYALVSTSADFSIGIPADKPRGSTDVAISICQVCKGYTVWHRTAIIYPDASTAPMPSDDMPDDVKVDFMEARSVFDRSPRAAGALLRLALQKLMPHVGEKGEHIDTNITLGGYDMPKAEEFEIRRVLLDQSDLERLWNISQFADLTSCGSCMVRDALERLKNSHEIISKMHQGGLDLREHPDLPILFVTVDHESRPLVAYDGNHRLLSQQLTFSNFDGVHAYTCTHPAVNRWGYYPSAAR